MENATHIIRKIANDFIDLFTMTEMLQKFYGHSAQNEMAKFIIIYKNHFESKKYKKIGRNVIVSGG